MEKSQRSGCGISQPVIHFQVLQCISVISFKVARKVHEYMDESKVTSIFRKARYNRKIEHMAA